MDAQFDPIHLIPIGGMALAALCLWGAMRSLRLRRLIADTPTCKTIAVFLGLVEVKGTAEAEEPVVGTLSGQKCVYYTWSAQEQWSRIVTETYTDSKGRTQVRTRVESGWTTVASGGETIPFYLRDDTGAIRIIPEKAKIEPLTTFSRSCGPTDPLYYDKAPRMAVPNSDHVRSFTEYAIPLHTPLYVMGTAREREDIVAAEIAHDPSSPIYLISTRTEESIRRGKAIAQWSLTILAGLLVIAGWVAPDFMERDQFNAPLALAAAGSFVVACALCWVWTVYNSLARLDQRVNRAWSHIDVELKRRHDLIPQLVSAVSGFQDYEQRLQQSIAHLRSQMNATAPGEDGPDPEAVAPDLLALAEAYPELKAGERFLSLQNQLVETEERIALARSYYNEITGHFNTRITVIPDRIVAILGRFRDRPFMQAKGFERAAVTVEFAE